MAASIHQLRAEESVRPYDSDVFRLLPHELALHLGERQMYRSWFGSLGSRKDIAVDQTVIEFLSDYDPSGEQRLATPLSLLELMDDRDVGEILPGLPYPRHVELWQPLMLLDRQSFGKNGMISSFGDTVFPLRGLRRDCLLHIASVRVRRHWRISILADPKLGQKFLEGTRFIVAMEHR